MVWTCGAARSLTWERGYLSVNLRGTPKFSHPKNEDWEQRLVLSFCSIVVDGNQIGCNHKTMTATEYATSRKETQEMIHASKVRREMIEMEKELYRRCRERRAA
tara:strand:+ start:38627 stop:38938 length:312 start_codon:yes stop_codon:yes gene_type:complete